MEASPVSIAEPGPGAEDPALTVAALLGIADGLGNVLLLDGGDLEPGRLAALLPNAEVIAVGVDRPPPGDGVHHTRVLAGTPLPFQRMSLRGVVTYGDPKGFVPEEIAELLTQGGRWVVMGPGEDAADGLGALGLSVVFESDAAVVVAR